MVVVSAPSSTEPDFADLQGERTFKSLRAFGASKASNLLFAFALARRIDPARVTVNETVKTVHENESIYIPIGAVHRLENPGKIGLELIEVQTGSYLGEDDIIRIEDDYKRA